MKKKRFFVIALLVFCMASAVTVCAGAKSRIIEEKDLDVRLFGWISFEKKPAFCRDIIYYRASVSGTDTDLIVKDKTGYEVCVRPMSNKKTLSKIQLSEDRKVATGEVKCGYNCAYGKLVMVCFTASNVLVSFDN